MSPSVAAVYAAKNARKWGYWAAMRYAEKHNGGKCSLFLAALDFEMRRREVAR